jgi:hypothetical protein
MSSLSTDLIRESNLPELHVAALQSKKSFVGSKANLKTLKTFLAQSGEAQSLCINGPSYCGKTYLTTLLLMSFMTRGKPSYYVSLSDLTESAFGKRDYELWSHCKTFPVLAIDNFEPSFLGLPYQRNIIRLFIKDRVDRGLVTVGVFLSSKNMAEYAAEWGDAFVQMIDLNFSRLVIPASVSITLRGRANRKLVS